MGKLTDFIDPDLSAGDVVHSNGYANAGLGGTIGGSSGGLSMEQRRKQLHGRRVVGSYQQSKLGRGYGAAKARSVDQKSSRAYFDASTGELTEAARYVHPSKDKPVSSTKRQAFNAGARDGAPATPQRRFVEPPVRRHNPYG